jgi:hypothetical protein
MASSRFTTTSLRGSYHTRRTSHGVDSATATYEAAEALVDSEQPSLICVPVDVI